jgi:hypothetical protein
MACGSVFSFIFATCEGKTDRLLEKSENANQKSGKLENCLLWKVPILHLGKMEIKRYVKQEIELEACKKQNICHRYFPLLLILPCSCFGSKCYS